MVYGTVSFSTQGYLQYPRFDQSIGVFFGVFQLFWGIFVGYFVVTSKLDGQQGLSSLNGGFPIYTGSITMNS